MKYTLEDLARMRKAIRDSREGISPELVEAKLQTLVLAGVTPDEMDARATAMDQWREKYAAAGKEKFVPFPGESPRDTVARCREEFLRENPMPAPLI